MTILKKHTRNKRAEYEQIKYGEIHSGRTNKAFLFLKVSKETQRIGQSISVSTYKAILSALTQRYQKIFAKMDGGTCQSKESDRRYFFSCCAYEQIILEQNF